MTPGWILQLRARGLDVRMQPCRGRTLRRRGGGGGVVRAALADDIVRQSGPIHLTEPQATAEVVRRLDRGGVLESDASPLGRVLLDAERCTLCGACATACPTEALRFDESPEETTISLTPGRLRRVQAL